MMWWRAHSFWCVRDFSGMTAPTGVRVSVSRLPRTKKRHGAFRQAALRQITTCFEVVFLFRPPLP